MRTVARPTSSRSVPGRAGRAGTVQSDGGTAGMTRMVGTPFMGRGGASAAARRSASALRRAKEASTASLAATPAGAAAWNRRAPALRRATRESRERGMGLGAATRDLLVPR